MKAENSSSPDRPAGHQRPKDAEVQRQATGDSLRSGEDFCRAVAELANDFIYIIDREDRVQYVNRFAASSFAVAPDRIIGCRRSDLFPPSVSERQKENLDRVFQTGEPLVTEDHIILPGTELWIDTRLVPLRNASGEVTAVLGISRDITRRKKTEEALRQAEESERRLRQRLATLIEITNELSRTASFDELCRRAIELGRARLGFERLAIWFLGEDPSCVVGSFGTDETGHVRDERGRRLPMEIGPRELLAQAQRTTAVRNENWPLRNDQGRTVGLGTLAYATIWDGEKILGFLYADNYLHHGPITDQDCEILTAYATQLGHLCSRKRAESALRESEELYRTILDHMQEAVILADESNVIRHINRFACSLLGTTPEDTVGRELIALHSPAVQDRVRAVVARFRGQPGADVVTVRRSLGEREVIFHFSPVRGPDGDYRGIITNIIDVTEQARMQQRLFEASRMEAIGTLAGGIAHDFNNLMATILGMASHLKRKRRPDDPDYDALAQMEEAAETAGKLAHQLLVFAKGGKILPRRVPFGHVVDRALAVCTLSIPANIRTERRMARDLWDVECDETQVQQVVMNLCRNAVDAMPQGGQLTISAENVTLQKPMDDARPPLPAGDYVCLTVEDTGCGIARDALPRIFDPFFTTKDKGHGLGLAAAYGIVRAHGGGISVASREGKGSAFRIWLPRVRDATE